MNRIRKYMDIYQVLTTTTIPTPLYPDTNIQIGFFDKYELTKYKIIETIDFSEAQNIAYNLPDIDWLKIVFNYRHIYQRLYNTLSMIVQKYEKNPGEFNFIGKLLNDEEFKNLIFDKMMNIPDRIGIRYDWTEIIVFTII